MAEIATERQRRLAAHPCSLILVGETPILDSSATAEVRRRTVQAMVDSKLCYIHKDHMQQVRVLLSTISS
eukprot:SAG11_NODE_103_length_16571_cov_49.569208_3_plen_70_part_00